MTSGDADIASSLSKPDLIVVSQLEESHATSNRLFDVLHDGALVGSCWFALDCVGFCCFSPRWSWNKVKFQNKEVYLSESYGSHPTLQVQASGHSTCMACVCGYPRPDHVLWRGSCICDSCVLVLLGG